MSMLRSIVDLETKLIIYHGIFCLAVQHGIVMWGSATNNDFIFKI